MLSSRHLSTDELEEFHFGRIQGPELRCISEHLEWCLECSERMEAVEHFIMLIRAAAIRGAFEVELLDQE